MRNKRLWLLLPLVIVIGVLAIFTGSTTTNTKTGKADIALDPLSIGR